MSDKTKQSGVNFFATAIAEMGSKKLGFTVAICCLLMYQVEYGDLLWLKAVCVSAVAAAYLLSQGLAEQGSGRHTPTKSK